MSAGCSCEYLSEKCGGLPVVCQYCHDVMKERLAAALLAKAELLDALEFYATDPSIGGECARVAINKAKGA